MAGVLPDGQRNLAFGLYYAGYGVGWLIGESIAQMLGARRTTVTLIARRLQFAGLIRYRRGRIIILDKVGLEHLACECYGAIRRQTERVLPGTDESARKTNQPLCAR